MTDLMGFHIEVLKGLNDAHAPCHPLPRETPVDPDELQYNGLSGCEREMRAYLKAKLNREPDELEAAEGPNWVQNQVDELLNTKEKKMAVSELIKGIDALAQAELRKEQEDVAQVKLKIKYRELAQARKVVSNIEREIDDLKHELSIELGR